METSKETPSWFVVISYEILTSKELTDKEKLLMGLISSLQGEQGYCYANNKYLADRLNCSPDTIKDLISNLVKLKWVQRKIYKGENNEFLKRILIIKMSKRQADIEDLEATPLGGNFHPPPPGKNPPTWVEKSPPIIEYTNKVVLEVQEAKKIEKKVEIDNLPTLEGIIAISNEVYKEKIWLEQICIATSTKITDMVKWMKVFNLSISNTEQINNITPRRYKSLFLGWMRTKTSKGVKLSDFTVDNTAGQQKQALAPPLTRINA